MYAEFQLSRLPGSGSFMIGKQQQKEDNNNSVELEASLAPAEAEVGAVAKADQLKWLAILMSYCTSGNFLIWLRELA